MTPYELALQSKEEQKKRELCISQNICPDCGGKLSIEEYSWESPLYDIVCTSCPPSIISIKEGFLFKREVQKIVPKVVKYCCM